MTRLPRMIIDLHKIVANFNTIRKRTQDSGITITTVLKGIAGDTTIAQALIEAGVTEIGDSRIENLLEFKKCFPKVRLIMLRLPSLSRIAEVTSVAALSLNSEAVTVAALERVGVAHQMMFMVDLGDLREGLSEADLGFLANACRSLRKIRATALGTNFSCFAGAVPTEAKLNHLVELANRLRTEFSLPIEQVSGGNSSSLPMVYQGKIPPGVNHLRIGEAILLGRETLHGNFLPDLNPDAFTVEAEIVQVQTKPALPDGEIGLDAFGRAPSFPVTKGGYRALLSIGHQDTPLTGLTPLDPNFMVLGGSSDYTVLACERKPAVGATVLFRPSYWSLLSLMTSPYVQKDYRK